MVIAASGGSLLGFVDERQVPEDLPVGREIDTSAAATKTGAKRPDDEGRNAAAGTNRSKRKIICKIVKRAEIMEVRSAGVPCSVVSRARKLSSGMARSNIGGNK